MDYIFCTNRAKEKIILDLVCLNLIQIIICVIIFVLMTSCAPFEQTSQWERSMTKFPKIEGFINAGFFSMRDSIYSQHCDSHGNQIWYKWDDNDQLWKHIKYNTLGCFEYENATGPESG